MDLFGSLILVQAILFLFCAFVFRFRMPEAVHSVIKNNTKRMDGSRSMRRKRIEMRAFGESMYRVYIGMAILFFGTMVVGLIVAGLFIPLPDLDAVHSKINHPVDLPGVVSSGAWRFPLVVIYSASTLFLAPVLIFNLYLSGLNHFFASANFRFLEYFRRDSHQEEVNRLHWAHQTTAKPESEFARAMD